MLDEQKRLFTIEEPDERLRAATDLFEKAYAIPAPWRGEETALDFSHFGFPCIMRRNRMGAWCGYVGVDACHQFYEKDWGEIDVSVHGGVTFASKAWWDDQDTRWWIGFDCAHAGDYCPVNVLYGPGGRLFTDDPFHYEIYRDQEYVRKEVEGLVEQLR